MVERHAFLYKQYLQQTGLIESEDEIYGKIEKGQITSVFLVNRWWKITQQVTLCGWQLLFALCWHQAYTANCQSASFWLVNQYITDATYAYLLTPLIA
jgi:hypothetical protein